MKCVKCNQDLIGKQTKFCSAKCKASQQNNCYPKQKIRAFKRKAEVVTRLGGKCSVCGYNKNYAVLNFHHTEPQNKLFNLDSRKLSNSSWDRIELELQKVILLCANCHMEIHHPDSEIVGGVGFEPTVQEL